MSKKFKVPTLSETQEELKSLLELASKFEGFRIRPNLKDEFQLASKLLEEGKDMEAVKALHALMGGIKATLTGFFRGCGKHFDHMRGQLEAEAPFEKDIASRVKKSLDEVEVYSKLQLGMDLNKAQELYASTLEVLRSAEKEQKERSTIRRQRREEENRLLEAQHAEENKEREAQRRQKNAEGLRSLANLINI